MKKLLTIFLISLFSLLFFNVGLFLILPSKALAHGLGLPPFFKIEDKIASASALQVAGVTPSFPVPQDLSSDKFLINQPINFEIDTSMLEVVLPKEVLEQTKFSWDFGDGTKGEGVKNVHAYSKMGSYILSVNGNYNRTDITQPLTETVQLDILPNKDYQLPRVVIKVNGQTRDDPLKGSINFDLNKTLNFDASDSKAPSSKIVEYTWDFGDGKKSNQKIVSHRYKLPQYYISPALQIKDENGFIAQTFIDITNSGKNEPNSGFSLEDFISPTIIFISAQVIIVALGLTWYLRRKRKKI